MSKLTNFKNSIGKSFNLAKIKVEKHGPLALIVVGTAGLVWAGIEAYKSKDKVNKTLDKYELMEQNEQEFTRTQVAMDIVKDVARPMLIGATGVAMIATGTAIHLKRLRYLTLGLAALTEEHERFLAHAKENLTEEEYAKLFTEQTEVVNQETGEVTTEAKAVANNSDLFARWWQYSELYGEYDEETREAFFRDVDNWATEYIMKHGFLPYPVLMEKLGFEVNAYQLNFGWYDTTGFYLEWSSHEVFDETIIGNKVEHLLKWRRPVSKY